jgi:hypothetical protein
MQDRLRRQDEKLLCTNTKIYNLKNIDHYKNSVASHPADEVDPAHPVIFFLIYKLLRNNSEPAGEADPAYSVNLFFNIFVIFTTRVSFVPSGYI